MALLWEETVQEALEKFISDPRRYRNRLEKLQKKYGPRGQAYELNQGGAYLIDFIDDQKKLAQLIASAVRDGSYRLSPARLKTLHLDKERIIYSFELLDLLIHGVVADALMVTLREKSSRHLYSYFAGISALTPLHEFSKFIRKHRSDVFQVEKRGQYVLRFDVKKYTEMIPVGQASPLWDQLVQLVSPQTLRKETLTLLKSVVRPEVRNDDGTLFTPLFGVPTGSPISTLIANLYLAPIDRALESIEGGFYARFGDDLLFAHPDPQITREVLQTVSLELKRLGLEANLEKQKILFFNGAGRPSPHWPEAQGTEYLNFLGHRIAFTGAVQLNSEKLHQTIEDLCSRLSASGKNLMGLVPTEKGKVLCQIANDALTPSHPFALPYSHFLTRVLNDRKQLKQLDYTIALHISQLVSGVSGVRSFRTVAYRTLREKWQLKSLVKIRNTHENRELAQGPGLHR